MYHIKYDKRSIQSSQMIYDALYELIQEKNYNDITITELVDRSKVGRATFYRNFDTIDDVLRMKCDEKFNECSKFLLEYYKNHGIEPNTYTPFFKPFLRFWYINSPIIELLILTDKTNIIKESFIKMCDLLSVYVPKDNDAPLEHYNYFLAIRSAIIVSVLTEWIKNEKNIPPDDLVNVLVNQVSFLVNVNLTI